jgi:hypothetical protein
MLQPAHTNTQTHTNKSLHLQVGSTEKKQKALDEQNGIAISDAVARVSDVAPLHAVDALVVGLERVFGKVIEAAEQGEGGDELDAKQCAGIGVFVVHETCNDEICNDAAGENPEVRGNVCSSGEFEKSLQGRGQRLSDMGMEGAVGNVRPRGTT